MTNLNRRQPNLQQSPPSDPVEACAVGVLAQRAAFVCVIGARGDDGYAQMIKEGCSRWPSGCAEMREREQDAG